MVKDCYIFSEWSDGSIINNINLKQFNFNIKMIRIP